ncbi:hypothetical protein ABZ923_01175 [Streptomyces sp. NPDC046881]|uniref:hypothetical protein n=1 Tax=Streptomyces sp. NPDC046881 TaxID=3155374 RepID=UPI0033C51DAC
MSDQHAAAALTAAAVIAAVLVARAAVLHHSSRGPVLDRSTSSGDETAPATAAFPADAAASVVREAEQHVHRCWQQLPTRVDPPE